MLDYFVKKYNLNITSMIRNGTVAVITMAGVGVLFGVKNIMIAFPIALTSTVIGRQNFYVKPLSRIGRILLLDLFIVLVAFISSLNPWTGILIDLVAIFLIIMVIFKSISVPVLLVLAIELAIFINLGIPYYTGTTIPFISSIVIGTIHLGATVDYAILLTSRFKELSNTNDKKEAMIKALQSSSRSIITSALTFFGATAGVGIISELEMISSLCVLMARGAIISMLVILFVLPGVLLMFEGIIVKTSKSFIMCKKEEK